MKKYTPKHSEYEQEANNVYVEDGCYMTVGSQRKPSINESEKPSEQLVQHRYCDTEKAPQRPIKKTICSVRKIDSVDDIGADQKKGMLGFFIPDKNIFIPCASKEQYFYLKRKIMQKKAKQKPTVSGYCLQNKQKSYNKLNNCSVPLDNGQLYDLNSCEMDRVQFM